MEADAFDWDTEEAAREWLELSRSEAIELFHAPSVDSIMCEGLSVIAGDVDWALRTLDMCIEQGRVPKNVWRLTHELS